MVLAFEDDENGPEDIRKAEKRKTFQRNLEEQGLELELEPSHVRMIFENIHSVEIMYISSHFLVKNT